MDYKEMDPPSFKYLRPDEYNKFHDQALKPIENLTKFHIDSFNWMIDQGLRHAIRRMPPVEMSLKNGSRLSLRFIVNLLSF
jgi:DNA-directed RNA polymerase beta subunit